MRGLPVNILILKILLLSILLAGCVTLATDYRKVGFREIQRGYSSLHKPSSLHETIELPKVTVHIVGDRNKFNWDQAATYGSPVLGYATQDNHIWVFGTEVKGRIIINQAVLGHELNHLLQFANPKVQNPDMLDDIGA